MVNSHKYWWEITMLNGKTQWKLTFLWSIFHSYARFAEGMDMETYGKWWKLWLIEIDDSAALWRGTVHVTAFKRSVGLQMDWPKRFGIWGFQMVSSFKWGFWCFLLMIHFSNHAVSHQILKGQRGQRSRAAAQLCPGFHCTAAAWSRSVRPGWPGLDPLPLTNNWWILMVANTCSSYSI